MNAILQAINNGIYMKACLAGKTLELQLECPVFQEISQIPPIVYLHKHIVNIDHVMDKFSRKSLVQYGIAFSAILNTQLTFVLKCKQMNPVKLQ